jgi:hypothetical protein
MSVSFKTTFFVGLFTLVIAGVMMFYDKNIKPQNVSHEAYKKAPIIAFEFAETPDDINKLFYVNENSEQKLNKKFIDKMLFINKIDFVFIISYVLFLALFSLSISRKNKIQIGYLGAIISGIVGLADVMENVQLFSILEQLDLSATYQPALTSLNVWTWIKWGLLGVLMVVLLPCLFRKNSGYFDYILGFLMLCVALSGVVAFVSQSPVWIARYTQFIFLLFPVIILYAFVAWRRKLT